MWHITLLVVWSATEASGPSILRAEMHERFARATLIQTALVNGDLTTAQHWAKMLASMAKDREVNDAFARRIGRDAAIVAEADNLTEAALQTARLANNCGACHEHNGLAGDRFRSTVDAPLGTSLPERMSRHFWAADRLWEGLIGHSESAWADAAAVLMEAPLTAVELGTEQRAANELAYNVNAIGKKALATAAWHARAELYGRLLVTCAQCHRLYRD